MRKLSLGFSVLAGLSLAVALGAQTPASSARQRQTSPTKEGTVTASGCLERAPASNDSAIGSNGTPSPIYVLTRPAEGVAGTSGTTGTSGITTSRSSVEYRLRTGDVGNLTLHEGDRVEVTGHPVGSGRTRTLKVTSLRELSGSCSE